ncbi:hypothetical protein NADFUDRAFT_83717 [Nadsonia fulvescens var. elongata DSM 6958]|uniref:Uncharacterized protein n=1 Tax=Nadsonia fulvescens var. elongata DSM 6958 TaxID=857566 RepID=A0A1E3PFG1_9ASCO|nr:hypothetical protein NADFUDRAFT_83717 [Nadsonia fulvescens var. elongata DSM 6958]
MYYGVLDKGKCHHRCVFYDGRCYSLGGTDLNWETLSEIRVLELPLSERSFRDSETIET